MTNEIKQLDAEKHSYLNGYKLTQEADSFVSYKRYRNLVNRKLKEAQNQFSENSFKKFEASEETRKFIKKKLEKKQPEQQ